MNARPALGLMALILAGLISTSARAAAPLPAPKPLQAPPAEAVETATGMSYVVIKAGPDPNRTAGSEFIASAGMP